MDRLIYTSMTGAKHLMYRQDTLAQNLANANTTGYRADSVALRAVPAQGQEAGTRVFTVETTIGADFSSGPMQSTGRALDVAVQGDGWIAVQGLDGNEAYTRAGNLQIGADGTLQLPNGLPVLGDGGPIVVPPDARISIGSDGTVSSKTMDSPQSNPVGRIKLTNPEGANLVKGLDGLFRTRDGEPAPADEAVRLADGTLEGSNVNVVEAMIGMIATARQFEMQMKLLTSAEQNEQKASTLVSNI
ncbi:MAG: flagellar basal-body rod protein FlgF [Burkholderiaceae bacterium]|jgi:flagellar basal-body rod protein FlgF|nr:flagellar basal-body rod protein FlgF [Burkholderiaceae bacterium]